MGFWALQLPVWYDRALAGSNTINPGVHSCQVSGHFFFAFVIVIPQCLVCAANFDLVIGPLHGSQVLIGYPAKSVFHRTFC